MLDEFRQLSISEKIRKIKELEFKDFKNHIDTWLEILPHEHWLVRKELIGKFSDLPDEVIIPMLISYLKPGSEISNIRNAAMEILTRFSRKSIPYLLKILNDPNPDRRLYAVVVLGEIADPTTLSRLKQLVTDPDENVAQAAIEAIGKIKSPEVVPYLIEVLNKNFWLQYPTIMILGELKDPSAVPALVKLMEEDEFLAFPVLDTLGKIGSKKALPAIIKVITNTSDEALIWEALKALWRIAGAEDSENIRKIIEDEDLIYILKTKNLFSYIANLLESSEPEEVEWAIKWCGLLQIETCVEKITTFLENDFYHDQAFKALELFDAHTLSKLKKFLSHPNKLLRRYILKLLTEKDIPLNEFINLITDTESIVRLELAVQLPRYGEDAIPFLFELLNDPDESVRNTAYIALTAYQPETIKKQLITMINGRAFYKESIKYFIDLAATFKIKEVTATLEELFQESAPELKLNILKAIVELDHTKGLKYFTTFMEESERDTKIKILSTISGKIKEDFLPFLEDLINSPDVEIRFNAYNAIASTNTEKALRILINKIPQEPQEDLRIFLISLLTFFPIEYLTKNKKLITQTLKSFLNTSSYDFQRELLRIIKLISPIQDSEFYNFLKKTISSPHWSVRLEAYRVIKANPHILSQNYLTNALKKENDALAFKELLFTLTYIKPDKAGDILLKRIPELPEENLKIANEVLPNLPISNPSEIDVEKLPYSTRVVIDKYITGSGQKDIEKREQMQ